MGIPLLAIAAAGSVMKGVGTLAAGFQTRKANLASALGAKIERDMAMLRRTQIGEEAREGLLTALGNIDAIRSTRGVSLDSQTGQMIQRRTRADSYRDEAVAALGELNRASAADQKRRGFQSASRWALPLAALSAAGDFGQAAAYGKQLKG